MLLTTSQPHKIIQLNTINAEIIKEKNIGDVCPRKPPPKVSHKKKKKHFKNFKFVLKIKN